MNHSETINLFIQLNPLVLSISPNVTMFSVEDQAEDVPIRYHNTLCPIARESRFGPELGYLNPMQTQCHTLFLRHRYILKVDFYHDTLILSIWNEAS